MELVPFCFRMHGLAHMYVLDRWLLKVTAKPVHLLGIIRAITSIDESYILGTGPTQKG